MRYKTKEGRNAYSFGFDAGAAIAFFMCSLISFMGIFVLLGMECEHWPLLFINFIMGIILSIYFSISALRTKK